MYALMIHAFMFVRPQIWGSELSSTDLKKGERDRGEQWGEGESGEKGRKGEKDGRR